MADDEKKSLDAKRVRNESVSLYDLDADDVLETQGYVVLDSSLGLVKPTTKAPSENHKEKT